jgi:hypothetical protein
VIVGVDPPVKSVRMTLSIFILLLAVPVAVARLILILTLPVTFTVSENVCTSLVAGGVKVEPTCVQDPPSFSEYSTNQSTCASVPYRLY